MLRQSKHLGGLKALSVHVLKDLNGQERVYTEVFILKSYSRYLLAEKRFSKIQVFEQRASVGGLWNHTPLNAPDKGFSIPRTAPTILPDTAVWAAGLDAAQFVSPVYNFLETNIPISLMKYSDSPFPPGSPLFPGHDEVRRYLEEYAKDLAPVISLQKQVVDIRKRGIPKAPRWHVEVLDLKTTQRARHEFAAVLVATGHYNDPFIPEIQGLAEFNKLYPGAVSHSKYFRDAEPYRGKVRPLCRFLGFGARRSDLLYCSKVANAPQKVIVVGHQASGLDISLQISSVCRQPVLISEKKKTKPPAPRAEEDDKPWARMVPQIAEIRAEERVVRFVDGDAATGVDAIVFCTGYFYAFPFLRSLDPPVTTDGFSARRLWEHMLYVDDPTLGFLGVPQRIVPFPVAEAQSAFIARVWSGRLRLPSRSEMQSWLTAMLAERGEGKLLHNLAFPQDVAYINQLHGWSRKASRRNGLENDGVGKIPPFWGAAEAWARERFPQIKMASRALGERRRHITSLEELGFDYTASDSI